MSVQVELACTVCAEEFQVPIGAYRERLGIVPCPRCGSTDLVLLGEGRSNDGPRCGSAALERHALTSS
jgi:predicted RNA-binding Zn-ribbon protein involved in translation (DUF1610 family)